jgi:antirestriction protein ArdC
MQTQSELQDLKDKIETLLDGALVDKDKLEALMAHYRVTGLYHYSMLNSIMIQIQGGTIAQSYKSWQAIGRQVKKGERARISIWRPASRPAAKSTQAETIETETGAAEVHTAGTSGRQAFWLCKVFDVSQTDGDPLQYDHNSAVPEGFDPAQFFTAAAALGFPVSAEPLAGSRGYTDGRRIVLSSLSNSVDKTKTLFHELGHCLLKHVGASEYSDSRSTKEVEAEIVAALCCSFFGVPYELSAAYIDGYSAGKDKIHKTRCIKAAQTIIKTVLGKE